MAPGEIDAYSGCDEEEDQGTDLYDSMFSDCVLGDVTEESDYNCSEREQNHPNQSHQHSVDQNNLYRQCPFI